MRAIGRILIVFLFSVGTLVVRAHADELPFTLESDPLLLPETALIETSKGAFEISFYREAAPITVQNFEHLGRKGYFKGLTFHRYVPDFVIQGGDPLGNGKGGPGYTLPPEHSSLKHLRGTIGMARKADQVNTERQSNGSQFYICLSEAPHLDGLYTVFARVLSGMENVEKLRPGDKIIAVRFPRKKANQQVTR